MGRRASRQPGSQETCSKECAPNLCNGRLQKESHMLLWGPDVTAAAQVGSGFFML
jgi:hypothetical protein